MVTLKGSDFRDGVSVESGEVGLEKGVVGGHLWSIQESLRLLCIAFYMSKIIILWTKHTTSNHY